MATDDDTQSRVERIIIRVQHGESITFVLQSEGLYNWFYRSLTKAEQAPVHRARAEAQARESQNQPARTGHRTSAVSGVYFELVKAKKDAFKKLCDELGTTLNKRMSKLITADIQAHRERVAAAQKESEEAAGQPD